MEELKEQIRTEFLARAMTTCINTDEFVDEILTLFQNWLKQAGYVQLDDDQSLPENPYYFDANAPFAHMDYTDEDYARLHTYPEAQQDMLKVGFKKVK